MKTAFKTIPIILAIALLPLAFIATVALVVIDSMQI